MLFYKSTSTHINGKRESANPPKCKKSINYVGDNFKPILSKYKKSIKCFFTVYPCTAGGGWSYRDLPSLRPQAGLSQPAPPQPSPPGKTTYIIVFQRKNMFQCSSEPFLFHQLKKKPTRYLFCLIFLFIHTRFEVVIILVYL